MTTIPNSNLPPQSQPWGRSVDQRIVDLQLAVDRIMRDSATNFKQISANVQLVSQRSQLSAVDTGIVSITAPSTSPGSTAYNTVTTEPDLTFLAYYPKTLVSYGARIQAGPSSSAGYGLARVLVDAVAQDFAFDLLVSADGPNGPGNEMVIKQFLLSTTPGDTYTLQMETGYIQGSSNTDIDYSDMYVAAVGIGNIA